MTLNKTVSNIHTHHHDHHHVPQDFNKAFIVGILLNSGFIIAEVIYGLHANSLALLTEAGHNASDVIGLFIAWGAILLSKRKASERFSFGLQSTSIISALLNAILLLLVTGALGWESIQRFYSPSPVSETTVITISTIGIFVNGITALLFMPGRKKDLNIRGAFLHMAGDALISFGIILSALLMLKTGWLWIDPLVSFTISIIIMLSTWGLLKDSFNLSLHATPKEIDPCKVRAYLNKLDGVKEVHDLHIWAISTTNVALSAHLLIPGGHPGDHFIKEITHTLKHDFQIDHCTLQIELDDSDSKCIRRKNQQCTP
ncbi:MAG: cation transporter [Alphaproteobacteria bacterium 16-39-46]|nr:MAG: cation transporter [Alphaproteobacteria bacterium 16-39-46]OZA42280.1 MAG: cation transporter [Alphaproteobacteria bacterium 17-39-52]HQS84051.1 cation diffusion facilitator family transporter [Alphaproteobacteria bacterium]HQS93913.1 cation diffusion facilitator family transporter [Alphaproteobacteria bacterium]